MRWLTVFLGGVLLMPVMAEAGIQECDKGGYTVLWVTCTSGGVDKCNAKSGLVISNIVYLPVNSNVYASVIPEFGDVTESDADIGSRLSPGSTPPCWSSEDEAIEERARIIREFGASPKKVFGVTLRSRR